MEAFEKGAVAVVAVANHDEMLQEIPLLLKLIILKHQFVMCHRYGTDGLVTCDVDMCY